MEPLSLAEMSFEIILKNVGSYGKQLRRKLAPPAREMLLAELTKHCGIYTKLDDGFAKVWADLPFILNSRTKEFRSRWLIDLYQYLDRSRPLRPILRQMLVHLSEQAPNLECLKLDFYWKDRRIRLDKQELIAIERMENLTKIVLHDVNMKLEDFRSLTIKCKNLQEVFAFHIEIEEKPTFAFEKFPIQIIELINLRVFQEKRIGIELRNVSSDGEITEGYRRLVLQLEEISQFSLMEKLTNLTQLELDCLYFDDEKMLEEFPYSLPNLDTAEINCSRGNLLRKFLEKNGEKLDNLSIFSLQVGEGMSYAQLFDWCPSLEQLRLKNWPLFGNEIRTTCLEKLQKIDIQIEDEFDFVFEDAGTGPVTQVSSILSAPNLKDVLIAVWKLDLGDYWGFIDKVTNREIFKNLKYLLLEDRDCSTYYYEEREYEYGNRGLEELRDAIKLSRPTN